MQPSRTSRRQIIVLDDSEVFQGSDNPRTSSRQSSARTGQLQQGSDNPRSARQGSENPGAETPHVSRQGSHNPPVARTGQTTRALPGKGQELQDKGQTTLGQTPRERSARVRQPISCQDRVRQPASCQRRDKSHRARVRQPWGRHPARVSARVRQPWGRHPHAFRQGSEVARKESVNPRAARDGTRATEQGSDNPGADTPHASWQGSNNPPVAG